MGKKGVFSDNMATLSLVGGAFVGVALYHLFKTSTDKLWMQIPGLNKIPAGD